MRGLIFPLSALLLLLAFNALVTPGFFDLEWRDGRLFGALVDILHHGSRIAIVALGMALVIGTGGVDLSVGAVAAIAGSVVAVLSSEHGLPWPLCILGALGVAALCGLWNGLLVTAFKLQPIVATLILMVTGRGIAQLLADGMILTVEDPGLSFLGNAALLGFPVTLWLLLFLFALTHLALHRSNAGLFLHATGGNPTASRLAGVPERLVRTLAYVVCAVGAGLSGLIECSYIKAADANNAGQLLELDVILAVVIGGNSLKGGRIDLPGAVLGAFILQTLTATLYMLDVSPDIAPAPKALAVLAVCFLQSPRLARRVERRRQRSLSGKGER